MNKTAPQLQQKLNRFDLTIIVIGSVIGSGIFLTPSGIAQQLPSPLLIMLVWLVGGVLALTGALTFAELASMMPQAGGVYVFLKEAFGGLTGFLYGWAYFLVVNTGALAALSIAFATYLAFFIPLSPFMLKAVAISSLVFLTAVNYFGVKFGGIFADILTVLKILGIVCLIFIGLFWGSPHTAHLDPVIPPIENIWSALALAMVGVLWSIGGWHHATFVAAEAQDRRKGVSFALITGTVIVTTVYLLTNLAYLFLLPVNRIAASDRIAADAAQAVLGPAAGSLISIIILISVFGTAGIYTMTAPRIYYAMASDGLFFKSVTKIHPKYNVPAFAIIFQTTWAIVLILSGTFYQLITYVAFTDWIFFALTGASIIYFRRRRPEANRAYRTPGYPFTPLIFVAISAWFVLNTLFGAPVQSLAGLGFLGLGVPVYYFWKSKNKIQTLPERG